MQEFNKSEVITEIQTFLEGSDELKYIVNIETNKYTNLADCIIHEPNKQKELRQIKYTPFIYIKDLKKFNVKLYNGDDELTRIKMKMYGITITKLETGNQERLENGYCYMVSSTYSLNAIHTFFKEGGLDFYEKKRDKRGKLEKKDNRDILVNRDLYYSVGNNEQFLISNNARIFNGIENYSDIHRVVFDIETTGLRYQICRVFAIGIRDNRGYEKVLSALVDNDDEAEKQLIIDLFEHIDYLKPAVILGHNSETFDFEFILGRAELLGLDIKSIRTSLSAKHPIWRREGATVKFGNTTNYYTATNMWGYSVVDTHHAAKKTQAINSDIKFTKLKWLCKFENIAKPNRMYINGEDNGIGKMWLDNKIHLINLENSSYIEIPDKFQVIGKSMFDLIENKDNTDANEFTERRKELLSINPEFIEWFKKECQPHGKTTFIEGRKILERYLLDDLWETEGIDELYNQSTFLLAKIVPTTYQRISTMGSAAVWNLLLTAWSYQNKLAIPHCDVQESFSGGLARCFKKGYSKRIVKIDYASLYPMIQLTEDIFPMFDITGVIKKMLTYMTTTRNIYKKLANGDHLTKEELELLLSTGQQETYDKYINDDFTKEERNLFKTKQLPIKILNNSLFGALGSGFAFNWSDNVCAARITCTGRLHLRHAVSWFRKYGCIPLQAVTDGINFEIPNYTNIIVDNFNETISEENILIEEAWKFGEFVGISALIERFNDEVKVEYEEKSTKKRNNFISLDNDGEFVSCYNVSRINYGLLYDKKDKKTGIVDRKVKITGNTIKSKTMPGYIEEFIDIALRMILDGRGSDFVEYYNKYVDEIFYMRIPLKKIASKRKFKKSLKDYINRPPDKNGKPGAKQAHMELLIEQRNGIAIDIFKDKFDMFTEGKTDKPFEDYTINEIHKLVSDHMPPEPELDSMIYYINIGLKKSDGDSKMIVDPITYLQHYAAKLVDMKEMEEDPDKTGKYNVLKYLDSFNNKVKVLIDGFKPEIREKILVKITKQKKMNEFGDRYYDIKLARNEFLNTDLELSCFDHDNISDAMFLEKKEVDFWNRTGYDPKLIWDGYSESELLPIRKEIYDYALEYVSDTMEKAGKPRVKSVNDILNSGDYILIKSFDTYSLGQHNGQYIKILRKDITIPKSEMQLELERVQLENQLSYDETKANVLAVIENEIDEKNATQAKLFAIEQQNFINFKLELKLPVKFTMDDLNNIVGGKEAYMSYLDSLIEDDDEDEYFED